MAKLFLNQQCIQKNLKLIIFDKDGTLIDIHRYWAGMIRLRAKKIVQRFSAEITNASKLETALVDVMGVDPQSDRMKPEGPVGIKPRKFIVKVVTELLNREEIHTNTEEIESIFKQIDKQTESNLSPLLRWLPGVEQFLDRCLENSVTLAIATTDKRERAIKAIKTLKKAEAFSCIVGADDVKRPKPDAECGKRILDELQIDPSQSVVIGDHLVDIQMGESAGVGKTVAVLTGLGSQHDFQSLNCGIAKNFSELEIRQ